MTDTPDNVSTALLTANRVRQQSARVDAMFEAVRAWRRDLVYALAQRQTEIDLMPDDPEMLSLCSEFRLWSFVTAALHADASELLTVNPHADQVPR
jgi:hypothetical protein